MSQETLQTTQQDENNSTSWWFGVAFLAVVLALVGYGLWAITHWLQDEQKLPIQDIQLSGPRTYLDDEQVIAQLKKEFQGSFFELNVNHVQQVVEDFPWIERASIRKDWPNKLKIYVVEQQASAIWNDDLLLNKNGQIFAPKNIIEFESQLPSLYGPGGSEKTALQGYKAMQKLLRTTGLSIEELQLSERFAWQVRLDNQVRLNLGRSQFIDRMQRFVDLHPLLSRQEKTLEYVDLRYDTGLSAGWQEKTENDKR
jgi:cell division protein FtsQ